LFGPSRTKGRHALSSSPALITAAVNASRHPQRDSDPGLIHADCLANVAPRGNRYGSPNRGATSVVPPCHSLHSCESQFCTVTHAHNLRSSPSIHRLPCDCSGNQGPFQEHSQISRNIRNERTCRTIDLQIELTCKCGMEGYKCSSGLTSTKGMPRCISGVCHSQMHAMHCCQFEANLCQPAARDYFEDNIYHFVHFIISDGS
jgi:hypothetical protein